MYIYAGIQACRQADMQANKPAGRQADMQASRQASLWADRRTCRRADKQASMQTDGQTGRQYTDTEYNRFFLPALSKGHNEMPQTTRHSVRDTSPKILKHANCINTVINTV